MPKPNFLKSFTNSKTARSVIETVAPTLATALGGPLAGVATKAIATKILGDPNATEQEVFDAVGSASPETLVQLKELEYEFSAKMEEAGVQFEQIAADDRANARAREIKSGDRMNGILAVLYTVAYFSHLLAISRGWVNSEILDNNAYLRSWVA